MDSILPPRTYHGGTVIFLHGLVCYINISERSSSNLNRFEVITSQGDTAAGWSLNSEDIQSRNPHLKFILPNAPIMPITINGGMKMVQYFAIVYITDCMA